MLIFYYIQIYKIQSGLRPQPNKIATTTSLNNWKVRCQSLIMNLSKNIN